MAVAPVYELAKATRSVKNGTMRLMGSRKEWGSRGLRARGVEKASQGEFFIA